MMGPKVFRIDRFGCNFDEISVVGKIACFLIFFCVFIKYGAGKMQIFDVQRLILKVFGGSWRRPGQALRGSGSPLGLLGS